MVRRVFVSEKSLLAKNVYRMILSKLGEIEFVSSDDQENFNDFLDRAGDANLLIVSQNVIGDRVDVFFRSLCDFLKGTKIPCVILTNRGSGKMWEKFSKPDKTEFIERPFFPEDFLKTVKKLWGIK